MKMSSSSSSGACIEYLLNTHTASFHGGFREKSNIDPLLKWLTFHEENKTETQKINRWKLIRDKQGTLKSWGCSRRPRLLLA